MIQGDLRHMDRSTTITGANRDAFDIESRVNEQLERLQLASSLVVSDDGKVAFGS